MAAVAPLLLVAVSSVTALLPPNAGLSLCSVLLPHWKAATARSPPVMKHAVATEHILDIIDDVRASLGGGLQGSQRAFYEELLASLPQFVAVGPQSAGKSSAVRRVCGISLPEASTLCTRIATLVQMRRSAEPSIRVTLVGPGGKELSAESNVDAKQVAAAVSKAQARRTLAL